MKYTIAGLPVQVTPDAPTDKLVVSQKVWDAILNTPALFRIRWVEELVLFDLADIEHWPPYGQ